MGSDMHMYAESWRARQTLVTWIDRDTIQVEKDMMMTGYKVVYKGKATPEILKLLKGMGTKIPRRKA